MGNLQRCNSRNSSICFNTMLVSTPATGCLVVSTTINTENYVPCSLFGVNKRGGDKGRRRIESKVIRDEAVWCSQDIEVKWKLVARNLCFLCGVLFRGGGEDNKIVWDCRAMFRETLLTRNVDDRCSVWKEESIFHKNGYFFCNDIYFILFLICTLFLIGEE